MNLKFFILNFRSVIQNFLFLIQNEVKNLFTSTNYLQILRHSVPLNDKWRLFFILTALLFTACDRRELTYDYHPYCEVTVEVDWSRFVETPSGMTVIFYPENGSEAITHTTHSVEKAKVSLRAGTYNIILFNQSPSEFGSIGFRGMERYETAEVFAQEPTSSKGWYSKAEGETVAVEPEHFGVATFEGFEVTEDMIAMQNKKREASRSTITLSPKNVAAQGTVTVHVDGIHNLRSVRGSISGMARGFRFAPFSNAEESVTHLLENWKIIPDADDYTNGTIVIDYSTFGMPGMKLSRAEAGTRAGIENTFSNAILDLSLLLVDNKTVINVSFQVKDHIEIEEGTGSIVLILKIVEAEPDPDNPDGPLIPIRPGEKPEGSVTTPPIALPDVKPEGGSSSGFDATVSDWGEEENFEVEL